MEKFNITFLKEPYNADNAFIRETKGFLTSADILKSTYRTVDTFVVKLNDLGLNSLHGEFNIVRHNGLWKMSDQDSGELNLIKQNIIYELEQLEKWDLRKKAHVENIMYPASAQLHPVISGNCKQHDTMVR